MRGLTLDPVADVEHLPYDDERYYFNQQGRRIIWMEKNDKYCAARWYANEEEAKQVMDVLRTKNDKCDIKVWEEREND